MITTKIFRKKRFLGCQKQHIQKHNSKKKPFLCITLAGYPGSGKSTVGKLLAKRLHMKYYYIGNIMRKMAAEQHITLEKMQKKAENDFDYDKKVDSYSVKLAKQEKNFVLDAHIGFYFIPKSVKIYLYVSPKNAAKRIMKDSRPEEKKVFTEKEALKKIKYRVSSENKRYKKYYNIDINDLNNYDIIIDTDNMSAKQIVDMIVKIVIR
jgi:predicted cytidylate kinase